VTQFESIDHAVDTAIITATLESDSRGLIESVEMDTDARGYEIPDFTIKVRGNTYRMSVIPCE
jgi:hypothetical protein